MRFWKYWLAAGTHRLTASCFRNHQRQAKLHTHTHTRIHTYAYARACTLHILPAAVTVHILQLSHFFTNIYQQRTYSFLVALLWQHFCRTHMHMRVHLNFVSLSTAVASSAATCRCRLRCQHLSSSFAPALQLPNNGVLVLMSLQVISFSKIRTYSSGNNNNNSNNGSENNNDTDNGSHTCWQNIILLRISRNTQRHSYTHTHSCL